MASSTAIPVQIMRLTQLLADQRAYLISDIEVQQDAFSRKYMVAFSIDGHRKAFDVVWHWDVENVLNQIAPQFPFAEAWADPVC